MDLTMIVLEGDVNSRRWAALSERSMELSVQIVPDFAAWQLAMTQIDRVVGLLDFNAAVNREQIRQRLRAASRLSSLSGPRRLLLAITDDQYARFGKQLLISGFSSVFCSFVRYERFVKTLRNYEDYTQRTARPEIALEDQIFARLPWQSAAENR